jgi:hypothetical protein
MDESGNMADSAHNRRNKRSLVLLAAKVITAKGAVDVRLRNLSQNGALLEAERPPAVGTELLFERGETRVDGRVAWSENGRFGVEFFVPIEESEVLIHVGRPKPRAETAPPVFRRSGFHGASLSAGERKIAESWVRPSGHKLGE